MELPFEKQFHFRDGSAVGSLNDLKAKIETMSYQEFYHHVNAQKNDFAAWIRHVLRDERLADDLQKVTSIVETVEIINDYLHPRPVTAPRIDLQSKIEQNVFPNPLPSTLEHPPIEDVQPITPRSTEVEDFTIIEENERADGKVREELFGSESAPVQPAPAQSARPAQPALSSDDMTRMIVKDFMYGLVFGLVIGIILGRLISF